MALHAPAAALVLCLWILSTVCVSSQSSNAASIRKLHCRYDVTDASKYWYKPNKYPLTLGCKQQNTAAGGVLDPTLMEYYKVTKDARGEWFNVIDWANKSRNCAADPTSTTCMSCSMNMPRYALEQRVVPFGVYDGWWLYPEPGAGCGMCYKIFMINGIMTPRCAKAKAAGRWNEEYETYTECPGDGNSPYLTNSQQPWAWRAKVYKDKATGLPYIIGINVEWYDLDSPVEYGVSYLTQGKNPIGMGSWPLKIQPTPCPVGSYKLEYAFITHNRNKQLWSEESFWKLQLAGQRISVSRVDIQWEGDSTWYRMIRSGDRTDTGYGDADGHWQTYTPRSISRDAKLSLKIYCADGSQPKVEKGLVPSKMTCRWQDPKCQRFMGTVQC